ncbi:MAG: hypothetical protein ACAI35_06800 [Candidatus Methylacidiphilales bacterium]|nr:hypothetical protein [Candidatus Methylacidiphilales bacterium]
MKERFDFKWGRDRGLAFERMLMEIGRAHGIFFTFEMADEPCLIPQDYVRKSLKEQLQYLEANCPEFLIEKSLLQNKLYHVISRDLLKDPSYPVNQTYRLKQDNVLYQFVERAMRNKTLWRTTHNIRAISRSPRQDYIVTTTKGILSFRDILSLTNFNKEPVVRWSVWVNRSLQQMQIGYMESLPEDPSLPAPPITVTQSPPLSDLVEPVVTSPSASN